MRNKGNSKNLPLPRGWHPGVLGLGHPRGSEAKTVQSIGDFFKCLGEYVGGWGMGE